MIWDHNVQSIVVLSTLNDMVSCSHSHYSHVFSLILYSSHQQSYPQFWPDDTVNIDNDHFRINYVSKMNKCDYVCREFLLQSNQDDYELSVRMLHCPSWPDLGHPSSIYDFIVDAHQRPNDYKNGPIVVVDRCV